MTEPNWMIYGANGYTGMLVVQEAVRRGHRPVLAGRRRERIEPLAERFGLPWKALDLSDESGLARAVGEVAVVYHAAGPFLRTSAPMLRACLAAGTSYVDITGELPVIQNAYALDGQARKAGLAILPACGFDVVPTDCLARHVAEKVPGATELEIAVAALSRTSAGTAKTMLEMVSGGGFVRRGGVLVREPYGRRSRRVRFPSRETTVFSAPLADLETAARTTGIGDITTYIAFPRVAVASVRAVAPLMNVLPLRRALQALAGRFIQGPDERMRTISRSYLWARAAGGGREAEAWLDTLEAYQLTAVVGVRAVERILAERPVGALTPAQAFGADFILDVPTTQRFDALPGQVGSKGTSPRARA